MAHTQSAQKEFTPTSVGVKKYNEVHSTEMNRGNKTLFIYLKFEVDFRRAHAFVKETVTTAK